MFNKQNLKFNFQFNCGEFIRLRGGGKDDFSSFQKQTQNVYMHVAFPKTHYLRT